MTSVTANKDTIQVLHPTSCFLILWQCLFKEAVLQTVPQLITVVLRVHLHGDLGFGTLTSHQSYSVTSWWITIPLLWFKTQLTKSKPKAGPELWTQHGQRQAQPRQKRPTDTSRNSQGRLKLQPPKVPHFPRRNLQTKSTVWTRPRLLQYTVSHVSSTKAVTIHSLACFGWLGLALRPQKP